MENEQQDSAPIQPTASAPFELGFEEIGNEAQVTALYAAMAVARAEFGPIIKNRTSGGGSKREFKYADLDASLDATVPSLSKHGLVLLQPLSMANGRAVVRTTLAHKDGGRMRACFDVPLPADGDVQEFGKNVTYSRRYQYNAMLCLAADPDKDDDGAAPDDRKPTQQRQEPRRTPEVPSNGPKATTERQASPSANAPRAGNSQMQGGGGQAERAPSSDNGPLVRNVPAYQTQPQGLSLASSPQKQEPTSNAGSTPQQAPKTEPTASQSPGGTSNQLNEDERRTVARLFNECGITGLAIRSFVDKVSGQSGAKMGRDNYTALIVALLSHKWSEASGVTKEQIATFVGQGPTGDIVQNAWNELENSAKERSK
jgi:hypothetical protein